MNKKSTTTQLQNCSIDCKNPSIAIAVILTVGVCHCVTIVTITKYNRDIDLTYKDFSLKIHPSVSTTAVIAA